jgi:hypothetical protein
MNLDFELNVGGPYQQLPDQGCQILSLRQANGQTLQKFLLLLSPLLHVIYNE